jgi:hypothetical protein
MTTDLPIACSLSATEMPKRLAEMAAIGQDSLIASDTTHGRAKLRFRDRPQTRERLEAVVAAESECCPFLKMSLRDDPGAVALTIEAPDGAEPVLTELVAAFVGSTR